MSEQRGWLRESWDWITSPVRARLMESSLRVAKLRLQHKAMQESASLGYAWVDTYSALIDRFRDGGDWWIPIGGMPYDRRSGKNFPFYSSEQELAYFRAASRLICNKNSFAIGILEALISYIVGDGFQYRVGLKGRRGEKAQDNREISLVNAGQEVVDEFLEREEWDEWESELVWRAHEDGEFLLRHFVADAGYTTVRTAEPEQLTQSGSGWSYEHGSFGIYTDMEDVSTPLRYHLRYMVDQNHASTGEFVEPKDIIHFKRNAKRANKRGMPDFSFDTLEAIDQAGKLRRNLSTGAAIQAAIVGIRQHETANRTAIQGFADEQAEYTRTNPFSGRVTSHVREESGQWHDIPKGLNYVRPPGAENAQAHIEVLAAGLRAAGVRWNAPEWIITGNDSQSSEASGLVVESPFIRWVRRQQKRYAKPFRRVMRAVILNAIEGGRLPPSAERLEITVTPSSPETRNKLEEAQANQIRVMGGWKSPQTVMQEEGLDVETELANLDEWDERRGAGQAGLPLPDQDGNLPGAAAKLDAFRQRLKENRDASGHEHDAKGRFGKGGGGGGGASVDPAVDKLDAMHDHLEPKKQGLVAKAHKFLSDKYASLEKDFGRAGAMTIMGATVTLMVVSPIPGPSLAPIAIAKAYKSLKSKHAGKAAGAREGTGDEDLVAAVREMIRETCQQTGEDAPDLTDDEIRQALEAAREE